MNISSSYPLLECRKLSKNFPGVRALNSVDFSIFAGKVHGLVGANGAGKSTLLKILAGVYQQDSGKIYNNGVLLDIHGTQNAIQQGIVTIHQDINLISSMTVTENILLNNEYSFKQFGLLNQKKMHSYVAALLVEYQIDIDPKAVVSTLPNDQKKLVQIIKAITRNAKILLMDEPTSSLTEKGIEFVHTLIKKLAKNNVAVVFISHYLSEIFDTADHISVLRDGNLVMNTDINKTHVAQVVFNMLGKEFQVEINEKNKSLSDKKLLQIDNLNIPNKVFDVSFSMQEGEILGATGLIGSGLTELSKAIFGFDLKRKQSGSIMINGRTTPIKSPHDAIKNGMALLTNDRLREGILSDFSIYENICLPILKRYKTKVGTLNIKEMVGTGEEAIKNLSIKAKNPMQPLKTLSGGNQQKVLVAKWLATKPALFIMDEPTIGIDVGSKEEIRTFIRNIALQGVGVLLLTAEHEELELLCDRVLVMFRGRLVAEFKDKEINKDAILHASAGGKNDRR